MPGALEEDVQLTSLIMSRTSAEQAILFWSGDCDVEDVRGDGTGNTDQFSDVADFFNGHFH